MEWVLIIFLMSGYGDAIDHVGGFKTQEACEAAIKYLPDPNNGWIGNRYIKTKCIKVN